MHDVILHETDGSAGGREGARIWGQNAMKGVRILGDRRAELTTIPRPEAGIGWAVLRSRMSAVCGSDLHIYRQRRSGGGSLEPDRRPRGGGVVEEVGPGVEDLAPGTRVVVFRHFGCDRCRYCRTGEPMFCPDRRTLGNHVDGADAKFVTAPASICLPLPDTLSDEVAALLACNLGTAFSGIRKLLLDGGAVVVAVDPVKSRRDLAESLGAVRTVDPTASDTATTIGEITHGQGAEASIDCSGNPRAQSDALAVLRPKGKMLVLAATAPWTIDPSQLWRKGLTLFGSWVYDLGQYERVVQLAQVRADSLERIVTRRFAGAEAEQAFEAADQASEGKVVIDWTR